MNVFHVNAGNSTEWCLREIYYISYVLIITDNLNAICLVAQYVKRQIKSYHLKQQLLEDLETVLSLCRSSLFCQFERTHTAFTQQRFQCSTLQQLLKRMQQIDYGLILLIQLPSLGPCFPFLDFGDTVQVSSTNEFFKGMDNIDWQMF